MLQLFNSSSWDFAFFHNLVEERKYNVNEMEIKEYFPLHVVVDGTLQIYQELLGLRFEKVGYRFICPLKCRMAFWTSITLLFAGCRCPRLA